MSRRRRNTSVAVADWRDAEDSKEKRNLYYCSREWGVLREAVRQRSGGVCERCNKNPMDACHHLTYERLYCEQLEDLQAICEGCHQFLHGKSEEDPARRFSFEDLPRQHRGTVELYFLACQQAGMDAAPAELVFELRSLEDMFFQPSLIKSAWRIGFEITCEFDGADCNALSGETSQLTNDPWKTFLEIQKWLGFPCDVGLYRWEFFADAWANLCEGNWYYRAAALVGVHVGRVRQN